MPDLGELDPRARALLNAYRDERGPSAAAAARLRAAVQRDIDGAIDRPGDAAPVVPIRRTRWLGPAVLTALAAVLVAALALRFDVLSGATTTPAAAPWQASPPASDAAIHRRPAAPPEPPTRPVAAPEPSPVAVPVKAAPRVQATKPDPPRDDLAGEMQLMRPAQLALADDRATDALAALARYVEKFPDGLLREEYRALHAAALCAAGRTDGGRDEARAFLRDHTDSLFAPRVRAACGLESAPGE